MQLYFFHFKISKTVFQFKCSNLKFALAWQILTDYFVLHQCNADEYGCFNGDCIPLESRCNEIRECADESDEVNCKLLTIQDNLYCQEFPPIALGKTITPVEANITVTYIDELNENSMRMSLKILVKLKWFDTRLKFYNLKGDMEKGLKVLSSFNWI